MSRTALWCIGLALTLAAALGGGVVVRHLQTATLSSSRRDASAAPAAKPGVTFNRDIVPIVYDRCAGCHRPGQPAPFSLLSFRDVQKRAKQIVEVTHSRYMPPWLPAPGYVEFADDRRLTDDQVELISQWVSAGCKEGAAADLPATPRFVSGWQLGEPDLVLTMPVAFQLYADGPDVYRNFVVPTALDRMRYVRAIEFRPGDTQGIHHAFVQVDTSRSSRRLEKQDSEPGYLGMDIADESRMPDGQLLSWQPGSTAAFEEPGIAWRLPKGADLVLLTHLHPTGKPETIQASVGLYFTDEPPTKSPFAMLLGSTDIDVSAGEKNYRITDDYVLPVDVEVAKVLPHSHYLAREIRSWATLPDGTKQWLMVIDHWNFDWQGAYRYAEPIFLPKGSRISAEFILDNSSDNLRNPNRPPQRVRYGLQSTDSMAELWLQVLPRSPQDLAVLGKDYLGRSSATEIVRRYRSMLLSMPDSPRAHTKLAGALQFVGAVDEAFEHLNAAVELDPDYGPAHFALGVLWTKNGDVERAIAAYETALKIDDEDYKSHDNLGMALLRRGQLDSANRHFERAHKINPQSVLPLVNLAQVAAQQGRLAEAERYLVRALAIEPDRLETQANLQKLRAFMRPQ